jgi:hypothetical protein
LDYIYARSTGPLFSKGYWMKILLLFGGGASGCRLLALAVATFLVALIDSTEVRADERPWRNTDSVGPRYYGQIWPAYGDNPKFTLVGPSPQGGRYFHVLSMRMDLACDCLQRTLEVFESAQVRRWVQSAQKDEPPVPPMRMVQMSTGGDRAVGGHQDAIEHVAWDKSGDSLTFLGTDEQDHDQIYRLHIGSGRLQVMTHDPYNKDRITVVGDLALYERSVPVDPSSPPAEQIVAVSRNSDGTISVPLEPPTEKVEYAANFKGEAEPWIVRLGHMLEGPFVAPDGRHAVAVTRELRQTSKSDSKFAGNNYVAIETGFILLDFERRQMRRIGVTLGVDRLDQMPVLSEGLWSDDSTTVVLRNVTSVMPTSTISTNDPQLAAFDVSSNKWQMLEPLVAAGGRVDSVGWRTPGELLVTHRNKDGRSAGTLYKKKAGRWVALSVSVLTPR